MDLLDKEFRLLVPHFLLFFPSHLQLLCSLLLTKVLFAGFLQALADGITASGAGFSRTCCSPALVGAVSPGVNT